MGDQFDVDLGALPGIVRGLGDRAREIEDQIDDAKDLASRLHSLGGTAAGLANHASDAARYIDHAKTGLFSIQTDLSERGQRLANAEGYAEVAQAFAEAAKPPPKHHWYDPVTDVAGKAWDVVSSNPMETLHTALDVVGFIPVVGDVADGVNALIYIAEGDWTNAAISGLAIIPVVGSAATGARLASRGVKIARGVARVANDADTASDAIRTGRHLPDGAEAASVALRGTDEVVAGRGAVRSGNGLVHGAASGAHPGAQAATSNVVSQASIVHSLRRSGSPEALATASMIKRGTIKLEMLPTDPDIARGAAGLYPFGGRKVQLMLDKLPTPASAAGITAHEAKHFLQDLTPASYRRLHEFEAYVVQRRVDPGFNLTDSQIWHHINTHPAYKNVKP